MTSVLKEMHNDVFYAPYSAFVKLYKNRFRTDSNVPFEEYIKHYACINVDGKIYCNSDDFRFKHYQNAVLYNQMGLKEHTMMPDAIVFGERVLKNRYGYNT